jgi:hypothetical protein
MTGLLPAELNALADDASSDGAVAGWAMVGSAGG